MTHQGQPSLLLQSLPRLLLSLFVVRCLVRALLLLRHLPPQAPNLPCDGRRCREGWEPCGDAVVHPFHEAEVRDCAGTGGCEPRSGVRRNRCPGVAAHVCLETRVGRCVHRAGCLCGGARPLIRDMGQGHPSHSRNGVDVTNASRHTSKHGRLIQSAPL